MSVVETHHSELLEKQRFVRVRRSVRVQVKPVGSSTDAQQGHTRNVSASGVAIDMSERIDPDCRMELTFMNGHPGLEVAVHGHVVWCEWNEDRSAYQTGVALEELSARQRENFINLFGDVSKQEKRRSVRLKNHLAVEVICGTWPWKHVQIAATADIGLGGMAIRVPQPYRQGQKVQVKTCLSTADGTLRTGSVVKKVEREHTGGFIVRLKFAGMEDAQIQRLARFLSRTITGAA